MLSYQHAYHAGNFADVVKHLTLSQLLHYMTTKEAPFFYLDTHAGKGFYDLQDKAAQKTAEAKSGIERLWPYRHQLPASCLAYLQTIEQCNPDGNLRYYPGSPALALHLLRKQDRLFFAELHPQEIDGLLKSRCKMKRHPRAHFSHCDGLQELHALLPPMERRGLIFIDPSYEVKSDYQQIPKILDQAYHRFASGVYCLWYPIIDKRLHENFLARLDRINVKSRLSIEFYFKPADLGGMYGCGLWIINPPYLLAEELKLSLKIISERLNPPYASFRISPH